MLTYSYGYSLLLLILSFLLSEVAGTVSGGYLELHIYTRLSAMQLPISQRFLQPLGKLKMFPEPLLRSKEY
jgi:hypothetical protein